MPKIIPGIILVYFQLFSLCYAQDTKQAFTLIENISYQNNDTLKADFYLPLNYQKQKNPVIIFVDGFGSDFRKWAHYTSWAKLAAAEGFIGVTYTSRPNYTQQSFENLLNYIFNTGIRDAADLERISIYGASGNATKALPFANKDNRIKAALIYYGTAKIESFRLDLPVLLVRSGLDNINLNKSIDTLAFRALQANAPYTILNFNTALHAFEDTGDPEIVRFMKASLEYLKTNTRELLRKSFAASENQVTAMRELYKSNWAGALAAFKQALQKSPGDNEIERQVGNIYIELKDYDKAVQSFNEALAHGNWRKGEIAKQKCLAYASLNNTEAAIAEMQVLKQIGWFEESEYTNNSIFRNIVKADAFKKMVESK